MQVHWNNKGSCWKHFLEHMEAMHEGVCHVATLGHPIQKSTIRKVATSQRRDVSTGSAPHHLKHQWFRMRGIGRRTNEGTEFQSSSDTDFEEVPVIYTVSNFLDIRMMFLRLNIFIFSFNMF